MHSLEQAPESASPLRKADLLIGAAVLMLCLLVFSGLVIPAEWVYFRGDAIYFIAVENAAREALRGGALPLWNIYFNEPLLANPQAALLYLPAMLLRWLPSTLALQLLTALHLWIGAMGIYWLLREWQIDRIAALCAALAYAFSNSLAWRIEVGHYGVICASAWPAWLLFSYRRLLLQRRWRDFLWSLLFLSLMATAGHIQVAAIGLLIPGSYFIVYSLTAARDRTWERVGTGLAISLGLGFLGAGLLAIQLLPLLEYLRLTTRAAGLSEFLANIGAMDLCGMAAMQMPPLSLRWPGVCSPFIPEFALYTVLPALGFAWIALRHADSERRPIVYWLSLMSLVSLMLAAGANLPFYPLLYRLMPFMRGPGRFVLWWNIALPLLGGFGLDLVFRSKSSDQLRRWRSALFAGMLLPAPIFAALLILWVQVNAPDRLQHPTTWLPPLLGPVLGIWLLTVIIWLLPLLRLPRANQHIRQQLVLSALMLDLSLSLAALWSLSFYTSASAYVAELAQLYDSLGLDPAEQRLDFIHEPGGRAAGVAGVPALQHYTASLQVTQELSSLPNDRGALALAAGWAVVEDREARPGWYLVRESALGRLIQKQGNPPRALVISDLIIAPTQEETLERLAYPTFDFRSQALISEPIPELAGLEPGVIADVKIVEYDADSVLMEVRSNGPGLLIVNDAWYPGWEASIDGQSARLHRVNHGSRGVVIGPGESLVEMCFRPASLRIGAWISAGTLLLLTLISLGFWLHGRLKEESGG